MKKTFTIFLVLLLLITALTSCSVNMENQETTTDQGVTANYEYLFRDLPEEKYISPATAFAGGDGTEANPYQISNAAELALLHEKIVEDNKNHKSDYMSAYYVLTNDIYVNDITNFDAWENSAPEYSWLPIGFDTVGFNGVLDGKDFTILGLYINTNSGTSDEYSTSNYGLFDTVCGMVKNIRIDKSYFSVSGNPCNLGSIAGLLMDKAVVENCTSTAVFKNYDASCGGIVGDISGGVDTDIINEGEEQEINYSKVINCTFAGSIEQVKDNAQTHIGGVAGTSSGNFDSCVNEGEISFTATNVDSVGGIAGFVTEGSIKNCSNKGNLYCETADESAFEITGGIAGKVFVSATGSEEYMSRGAVISKCENSGAVNGQMYAGGIAGEVFNDHNNYCVTISDCINNGTVGAKEYTGGIIGHMNCIGEKADGESIIVENCENKADLAKGTVGGIISSLMSNTGDFTIKNCINSGNLTSAEQHCAGIIAYWIMNGTPSNSNIVINSCKNTGSISSALNAGGIISFMDMPVCIEMGNNIEISIANCVNSGSVSTNAVNGYIGGILGNWGMANIPTTIDKCTNSGTLAINAATEGVSGEENKIMTISRIAGGIVGRVGSGLLLTIDSDKKDEKNVQTESADLKITNSNNTGKLEVSNEDAKNIMNLFGGIIGNTCAEDGFAIFSDKCTYIGFDRGLGNKDFTDIGNKVK